MLTELNGPTTPFSHIASIRRVDKLACIARKSFEICERFRLWQQNYPATPETSAAFSREEVKLQEFRSCRSSGDEYLVESTASRVEIVIAWRLINHHPETGKPPSHSATPELLQLLQSLRTGS